MRIDKYNDFNKINEEFILGALKGALGKLFQVFAAPFKDLSNDFKKLFDEEDPNSVKNVIMNNFNQAIDAAQKQIGTVADEGSLTNIFPQMMTSLIQLSQNLDKDIMTGLGKDKLGPVKKISQVIILGSQKAGYAGIVGILDPNNKEQQNICKKLGLGDPTKIQTSFKFNKAAYEKSLQAAGAKGGFEAKKKAAFAFFDNLQKAIQSEIDKELTEEEIKNIYDTAKGEGRSTEGVVKLKWAKIEIEIEKAENGWKLINSTSIKLKKPKTGEVTFTINGEANVGSRVKFENIKKDNVEFLIDGDASYETGKLDEIQVDGKIVNNYKFGGKEQGLKTKLAELRNKKGALDRVEKFADFLSKGDEAKIKQVQAILGGEK